MGVKTAATSVLVTAIADTHVGTRLSPARGSCCWSCLRRVRSAFRVVLDGGGGGEEQKGGGLNVRLL